jgi:hypothetical protein
MMAMVHAEAPEGLKTHWEESKFVQRLMESMHYRCSTRTERTRYILWKTDVERFIRYESLRPQIVGNLNASCDLPARKRQCLPRTAFDFKEEETEKKRDGFFKWMRGSPTAPQLNTIILGRIVAGIEDKYESDPPNKSSPAWRDRYLDICMKHDINLGEFWDSTRLFVCAVVEFKRIKTLKPGLQGNSRMYRANQAMWGYPGSAAGHGPIRLFIYPQPVEDEMDGYLVQRNWTKAVMMAQEGFLTENFLKFLVKAKHFHTANSGNLTKKTAADLSADLWSLD